MNDRRLVLSVVTAKTLLDRPNGPVDTTGTQMKCTYAVSPSEQLIGRFLMRRQMPTNAKQLIQKFSVFHRPVRRVYTQDKLVTRILDVHRHHHLVHCYFVTPSNRVLCSQPFCPNDRLFSRPVLELLHIFPFESIMVA